MKLCLTISLQRISPLYPHSNFKVSRFRRVWNYRICHAYAKLDLDFVIQKFGEGPCPLGVAVCLPLSKCLSIHLSLRLLSFNSAHPFYRPLFCASWLLATLLLFCRLWAILSLFCFPLFSLTKHMCFLAGKSQINFWTFSKLFHFKT